MGLEGDRTSEERQLALLVSSAVDYAIFMLDPAGTVRTWNPGAERLKGYAREEIVGRHFSVFYTDEDRARDHPGDELRLAIRDGRYEEEGWRVRKDGTTFWANVVITAIRDEAGGLIGFGKVSRDLTLRRDDDERRRAKAAELEITNRELAEFRRLVSSVRDYAIFMLDPRGHVLSWNTGAQHLKGYTPEEIIGRHFSTFYTSEDLARDHPAWELEVAAREGRYEEEGWRVRKDGSTFWATVTITAIRDDDDPGRLVGFAKVTRDLTERKSAEDALRSAIEDLRAANAELDRFASVAAHDMTDPLRTISGFAEVLADDDVSPEEAREFAQHILDSALRLTGMLRGLLTYARAGRSDVTPAAVNLADTVATVRDDLAARVAERGAQVSVAVPGGADVLCDPDDLRVILQNLLSNAAKFADADAPVVEVAAERTGDRGWRVAVTDNGRGIPAEEQSAIFSAFVRASGSATEAGYGLGLATCHRLVERHGGTIGVESEPGHGSTFWFTLPAPADPA